MEIIPLTIVNKNINILAHNKINCYNDSINVNFSSTGLVGSGLIIFESVCPVHSQPCKGLFFLSFFRSVLYVN